MGHADELSVSGRAMTQAELDAYESDRVDLLAEIAQAERDREQASDVLDADCALVRAERES